VEIQRLRRSANFHRADVKRVIHLVLGFDFATLAVILDLAQDWFGRLLRLRLEGIFEGLLSDLAR
jgi:hypothetical protein